MRKLLAACMTVAAGGSALAQAPAEPVSAQVALAQAPSLTLDNGVLRALVLRPDPVRGFYRGTRFDWSGMIASLRYRDREYYGPWFDALSPDVSDYVFQGDRIVVGVNSRAMGPADTFDSTSPPGWTEAVPGGTFIKIGVGVLRKPADGKAYSQFVPYEIVDGGRWTTRASRSGVEFRQAVKDAAGAYGYDYRKTLQLIPGKPAMTIGHTLTNTGRRPITTTLYNHNFLTLAGPVANAGVSVSAAFALAAVQPPRSDALVFANGAVRYGRGLATGEAASAGLRGFGSGAADFDLKVTDAAGAGYRLIGDRPLSSLSMWSIRSNVSVEPFLTITIAPGQSASWRYSYTYLAGAAG